MVQDLSSKSWVEPGNLRRSQGLRGSRALRESREAPSPFGDLGTYDEPKQKNAINISISIL